MNRQRHGDRWTRARLTAGVAAVCLLAATAALCARPLPLRAQQSAQSAQYVDSVETYQRRIEGLIGDRLSALLPAGGYVVRATVTGRPERVPRRVVGGTVMDLPGFRPSAGEAGGVEKVRVEQVSVRVVLNRQLPPADLQYIRTIVPILADFRPERGDRLDVQVIPGTPRPGEPAVEGPSTLDRPGPLGITWQEWIFLGVGAVLLIALLRFMWRLTAPRKVEPPPAPPPMPRAPEPPGMSAAEQRRMEQERQLAELRHGVVKRIFARPDVGRELVMSMGAQANKIDALASALGRSIARQALLPTLGPEEYQAVEERAFGVKPPDVSRQINTLQEAQLYLLTQEIANPEVLSFNPFRFLDSLSWGQVVHLIKDEPLNVKAIVVSRLKPDDMAKVLESMPKELQLEIAVAIGNLHDLPLQMAQSVATDLAEKARGLPDSKQVDIEGPTALVDLMGRTSSDTSRYLLEGMKSKDARLSQEVEKRFFMFEAIPLVPDEIVPQAVRTMPSSVLIQALQGAPPEVQRKVVMAFPESARNGLVTALRASRADPDTVEEARRRVVAQFRELGRQGRINLKQISDAWAARSKAS